MYHPKSLTRIALVLAFALIIGTVVTAFAPATAQAASEQSYGYGHYHWVTKGESLSKIARRYSVTVYQLAKANGLSTTSHIYVGQKILIPSAYGAPAGCARYYYVKKGQTLSQIAKYLGVNYSALARANKISNPDHIYYGQRLCIPNIYGYGSGYAPSKGYGYAPSKNYGYGKTYIVKKGDTLSKIAKWYGVSTYRLAQANGISNINHIYYGQRLSIPGY